MDGLLYTVLLEFDVTDKHLRQKVIDRLAQIDPTASQRLESIKNGRICVKKNTPLATARRLVDILSKTGATCRLQEQTNDQNRILPRESPLSTRPGGPSGPIRCPNCHFEQPAAVECRKCGVIIEKAHRLCVKTLRGKSPKPQVQKKHPKNKILNIIQKHGRTAFSALINARPIKSGTIKNWQQRLVDRILTCVVVLFFALVLETCLLVLSQILWYSYLATEVGRYYVMHFPEKAAAIQGLMSIDLLSLSLDSTLISLYTCLLLSVMAQLLHLRRYLFDTQGLIGKLILWFAPATALAAWGIMWQYQFTLYLPTIGLVVLPTGFILVSCMQLARDTLPEIGMLWDMAATAARKFTHQRWTRIK